MIRELPDKSNVYFIGGERFVIPYQVSKSFDIMQEWDQERIDKMKVEIDRLCWHYPEKGELPQVNESGSVDVIIEGYNEIWDIDEYKDRDDYKRHWIEQIKRWRYIE